MINLITEEIDVSDYSDEDFLEIFVTEFRPWIKKNHGDEIGEYPMSLLVKKYIKDFANENGVDEKVFRYANTMTIMGRIGRELAEKEVRRLPSLSRGYMFTEKFKKILDHFISNYTFPDFVKFHIEEPSPFRVRAWISVEFEPAMKYDGDMNKIHRFKEEFTKFITEYLGFEIGSPIHGHLNFSFNSDYKINGIDEWITNVFNKKIKKDAKSLPDKSAAHSMKFTMNHYHLRGTIEIIYGRHAYRNERESFESEFKEYLLKSGYNPDRLQVV